MGCFSCGTLQHDLSAMQKCQHCSKCVLCSECVVNVRNNRHEYLIWNDATNSYTKGKYKKYENTCPACFHYWRGEPLSEQIINDILERVLVKVKCDCPIRSQPMDHNETLRLC